MNARPTPEEHRAALSAGLELLARLEVCERKLAAAEARIRELEQAHADDMRRLWTHIGNMPGGI